MKKIVLFAAAGLFATATIVYATVEKKAPKKEVTKKEVTVKKSKSCNRANHQCVL